MSLVPGSKVDGRIDPDESRIEYRARRKPGRTVGDGVVRLVEDGPRVRVEQVVEVECDVGSRAAESQNLADAHVDAIETIRELVSEREQVDRLERLTGRERPDRLLLQNRARDVVVGRERIAVASDRVARRRRV